jgi:hypothetical protein
MFKRYPHPNIRAYPANPACAPALLAFPDRSRVKGRQTAALIPYEVMNLRHPAR